MDPAIKKKALRMITYGLFVATSRDDSGPAAGTINWISQSSFTPPLIMVAIKGDSALHRAITASRTFIVHVVGKDQKDLATAFFRGAELSGDRLNGYGIESSPNGIPLLVDPPAWFECRVVNEVRGGDHTVFVAEVTEAGVRNDAEPLTLRDTGFFYGG
jgi:flavin reductase (DIM6/NTAB) family NADH-FMN oxidoreductase RutF